MQSLDDTIAVAIIKLWNEAHDVGYVAMKLGLYDDVGELDTNMVEMVIDDPANYELSKQQPRRRIK
jgi:hypothetical protein